MSSLTVYHQSSPDVPNKMLTHLEDIASTLGYAGVRFERLQASTRVGCGASQGEVIAACGPQIDTLKAEHGYVTVDVISLDNSNPQKEALRTAFLDEQCQREDGTFFFVAGRGLLSLRIDDYVYAVLCERHDVLSVPAGIRHWFDIGEFPNLAAVRLSKNAEGWTAKPTGDDIASRFPRLED